MQPSSHSESAASPGKQAVLMSAVQKKAHGEWGSGSPYIVCVGVGFKQMPAQQGLSTGCQTPGRPRSWP